jgi:hypothetical protein
MAVDPIYYGTHVFFFLWGAVLLGFFVKGLVEEVGAKGWYSARSLWASCLCLSSGVFVINMLDPRGALGVYPDNLLKFIEWVEVIALSSSFAFSGYMYLAALYHRSMSAVPNFLRNYFLVINVVFSIVHAIFSSIGAASGNLYWFGVDQCILSIQEIALTLVLNVSICKLSRYLHELNQEKTKLGAATTNFNEALRKMMYIRVFSIAMTIAAVLFQLALPGGGIDRISRPFTPIVYDNTKFSGLSLISPLLCTLLHSLLLYMLRRPQPKSERPSERTKETSTSSTLSRPSHPSTLPPTNISMTPPVAVTVSEVADVAIGAVVADVAVDVVVKKDGYIADGDIPVVI